MKDLGGKSDTNGSSFIRLSLRKPREWKVALTTSVSSPAIIPPKIQLWDEDRGDMILETTQERVACARSKSASFVRRGAKNPAGRRESGREQVKHHKVDLPVNNTTIQYRTHPQEDVRHGRSKSLVARGAEEVLVQPVDCVRPRTPVMVARRVSLSRESSSRSQPTERVPTQHNGITTHHRRQFSEEDHRRKVKHNVSFGRVDTYDDSSSFTSGLSANKFKERSRISRQSGSYSSSPQIVVTEPADNEVEPHQKAVSHSNKSKRAKQRSRSKIPVLVKKHSDSSVISEIQNCPCNNKLPIKSNSLGNGYRSHKSHDNKVSSEVKGRKSRMELFMCDGDSKHRFDLIRLSDLPEPPPLPPPPAYTDNRAHHHFPCERGNCPFDKYFDNPPTLNRPVLRTSSKNRSKERNSFMMTPPTVETQKKYGKERNVIQNEDRRKRDGSKPRRRRVPSKCREQMMSLSSSSDSEDFKNPRIPPRRRRRSQNPRGDRLLGVNGHHVRSPQEAEELIRASEEVVQLHLQRNGVSQSLPRHPVEPEDYDLTMGSNMSRHSGKGLTGRRSQSSGNLCNGKVGSHGPGVTRFFSPCGRGNQDSVRPRDRYKFCGSLPNHLDAKDPALEEVSEVDDNSSYRNNNNVRHLKKNDVLLRLQPLVPRADSVTHDQGYASERSPEDELPPDLPPPGTADQLTCPVHHPSSKPVYPFLHKNSTFTVKLVKGTRGLGLSVTGGVDTEEQWPGLIRVKRLFPHQPAWQSGQLAQGDFLLVANNTSLVGLTNYEALEVLRTAPTEVVLTVCRPPPELQVLSIQPPAESAPVPPRRDPPSTSSLQLPLKRMESFGEFEITLKKVNGSLGFTLRKEDESVLGHYVRALVREPVLSDGRVKPGDKIVAVNGVDMSPMSHEEAVMFLRQCGQEVHLKLFRDPAQTPVQALSPTESHRTFKPILRKEAQDMLSDLAVKKSMSPKDSGGYSTLSSAGRTSSPRKRRLTKTPSPDLESERQENHLPWPDEVLERVSPGYEGEKPKRPDSLNFAAERKPHFQFSAVNSNKTRESLDSLDSLDCCGSLGKMDSQLGPLPSEPVSMPPLLTSTSDSTIGFSYRNPAYRSANPAPSKSKSSLSEDLPENRCSDNDLTGGMNSDGGKEGSKGLLKWKGIVFTPEDGTENATSPEDSISQITEVDTSSNQVLVVELNRGWNSRLGFSLQQSGRSTLISAIHPDSVASRDGRLRAGDQLIMVNDESVEGMSTTEVINLLRKIRGSICITVWRKFT